MLKINFFTEFLHLFKSFLSLLNNDRLCNAVRKLFGGVVSIDYKNSGFINDSLRNTITQGLDDN